MKKAILALCMVIVALVSACKDSDRPERETVSATAQALTHSTTVQPLSFLLGEYHSCIQHPDGSPWSIRFAGTTGTNPLPQPPLKVVQNDVGCQLSVTAVYSEDGSNRYLPATPAPVLDSYSPTPFVFAHQGGTDNPIYANLKANDILFDNNFVITFKYSDDATSVDVTVGSNYSVVSGAATIERVPAPNYTIDIGDIIVDTDAQGTVTATWNAALFTLAGQSAEEYVIVPSAVALTWNDIHEAAAANPHHPWTPGGGADGMIHTSNLVTLGQTLPTDVSVIAIHTEDAVPAYQIFVIHFL